MEACAVLIADDNPRLSRLIAELLADEPGFQVLDVLASADDTLAVAAREQPDVILLSERLGGSPVDQLCRKLRALAPESALAVWSHDAARPREAHAMADGVMERGTAFRHVVRGLRQLASGCGRRARDTRIREDGARDGRAAAPAEHRRTLDTASGGGLLLRCEDCDVRVRLQTDDVAPAVDEARSFFLEHDGCATAIDLAERAGLDLPAQRAQQA